MRYKVEMSGDGRDLLETILYQWIEDAAEGFADELAANYWQDESDGDIVADARVLARAGAMLLQLREQAEPVTPITTQEEREALGLGGRMPIAVEVV